MRGWKRWKVWVVGLVAFGALFGCYTNVYTYGTGAPLTSRPVYSNWQNHFFFGLIGNPTVDVRKFCPSMNATVINQVSLINAAINVLTLNMYTPTTTTIYCADTGATLEVPFTQEQAEEMAASPEFIDLVREEMPSRVDEVIAAQSKL